jgi:hypothetical protein
MDVTLNRSRLQEVAEVLKHLGEKHSGSPISDKVLVRSEPGKVSLTATNGEVDVMYYASLPDSPGAAGPFLVPLATLTKLAEGQEGPVQVSGEPEEAAAMEKYPTFDTTAPKRRHFADWPALRGHLRNAGMVVASGSDRYSINCICLNKASVVATDGRQLYAGNNLSLPLRKGQAWLIAPSKLFASRTLSNYLKVVLVREEAGMVFRFGENWMVRLHRQEGRFPHWQECVPKLKEARAKLVIPETVAVDMPERLRQLLDGANPDTSLSLQLGAKNTLAAVDVEGKEIRSMELDGCTRTGEEMALLFDPKYLIQALKLGFLTLHGFAPNRPVIATRGSDIYLWMPIFDEDAATPNAQGPGNGGPQDGQQDPAPFVRQRGRRKTLEVKRKAPQSLSDIAAELEAIRDSLGDLSRRIGTVQAFIRAQGIEIEKREKAVHHALGALKHLQVSA